MREKVRMIFLQMTLIGFLILVWFSVVCAFADYQPEWYTPLSIVVIAFLTSLPTLILGNGENGRTGKLRIALHYLALLAIVLLGGYVFKWYSGLDGGICLFIVFSVIYISVWIYTSLMYKHDERAINEALEKTHDSE